MMQVRMNKKKLSKIIKMNNILICGLSSLLISMFYYFYLSSNYSSIDNEKD